MLIEVVESAAWASSVTVVIVGEGSFGRAGRITLIVTGIEVRSLIRTGFVADLAEGIRSLDRASCTANVVIGIRGLRRAG